MGLPLALSTLIKYAFSLCQQEGERVRGRDKRQKMISARAGKNAYFGAEPLSTKHHAETNTWRASQSLCTHTCTPCTRMHTNTHTHTRGLEQRHFWRVSISRGPLRAMADKNSQRSLPQCIYYAKSQYEVLLRSFAARRIDGLFQPHPEIDYSQNRSQDLRGDYCCMQSRFSGSHAIVLPSM